MTCIERFEDLEASLRKKHGEPGNNVVTVSGLVGVGTSTIARMVSEDMDLERIDAGEFFREKARSYGMPIDEFDRRTEELEEREGTDFDVQWEERCLKTAFREDDVLLEGRLSGALLCDIAPIRIYVVCDREVAVERIAGRENISVEESRRYVEERNSEVVKRYSRKYGVDPRNEDFYNLFIDNSRDVEEVRESVEKEISRMS